MIPDRVNLASDEATVFITDIYQGPGLQGVPRGTVKKLRVIEYYFSRRGFGGLYGTLGLDGPWDVKRILGTVPVEADGSAHFKIPANSPLSLQPLDEQGPGAAAHAQLVRRHAGRSGLLRRLPRTAERSLARTSRRWPRGARPSPIEPWHGPARGFSFVREVQPVLDRYCVSCHDGGQPSRPAATPRSLALPERRPAAHGLVQPARRAAGTAAASSPKPISNCSGSCAGPASKATAGCSRPLDYHFSTTELGQLLRQGPSRRDAGRRGLGTARRLGRFQRAVLRHLGRDPAVLPGTRRRRSAWPTCQQRARWSCAASMCPWARIPDYEAIPDTPRFDTDAGATALGTREPEDRRAV